MDSLGFDGFLQVAVGMVNKSVAGTDNHEVRETRSVSDTENRSERVIKKVTNAGNHGVETKMLIPTKDHEKGTRLAVHDINCPDPGEDPYVEEGTRLWAEQTGWEAPEFEVALWGAWIIPCSRMRS
jgi:NADPH-dependent glutamate synthase beta subunit-like oxidoreductase